MAEEIVLEIKVDDDDLLQAGKRVDELTASLVELENEQKSLKEENKRAQKELEALNKSRADGAKLTAEEEEQTKRLKEQIVSNNTVIALNQQAIQKNRRERTNSIKLMDTEQGTRARLRQKVAELNKQYNEINQTTVEGAQKAQRLAAEMKDINDELNEGSKAAGQFKDNIGNYPEILQRTSGGLLSAASGIKSMASEALNFIKTPLGAVLTAVVSVVGLLGSAMSRSASSTRKLNQTAAAASGVWDFFMDKMGGVVDWILDKALGAINMLIESLRVLGVIEPGGEIDKFIKGSQDLVEAEDALLFAEKQLEKQQLQSQLQAERLRQVRDDESKTIDERIKANEDLGNVLTGQIEKERALANQILNTAKLRAQQKGETIENLLAIEDAEIKLLEIQERVESQRSEQLVNTNSLLREKADLEAKNRQDFLDNTAALTEASAENIETINEEIAKQIELGAAIDEVTEAQAGMTFEVEKSKISINDFLSIVKTGIDTVFSLFQTSTDNRLKQLKNQKEAELALVEGNSEETERINREFLNRENKLRKKEFNQNKLKTIADIGIQTALNIIKLFTNPPLAIAAGIAGGIQAGIVAATTFEPETFAEGGTIINGPPHSAGGIDVYGSNGQYFGNVEGGESMFVLKKSATEAMQLSRFNQSFGGRSFYEKPTRINADGGTLAVQDQLTPQDIANAIQGIQIVVGVKDIITGIDRRVQVLENAKA